MSSSDDGSSLAALRRKHARFMAEAISEAQKGLAEGGIPIGSIIWSVLLLGTLE